MLQNTAGKEEGGVFGACLFTYTCRKTRQGGKEVGRISEKPALGIYVYLLGIKGGSFSQWWRVLTPHHNLRTRDKTVTPRRFLALSHPGRSRFHIRTLPPPNFRRAKVLFTADLILAAGGVHFIFIYV